jgi:transposase
MTLKQAAARKAKAERDFEQAVVWALLKDRKSVIEVAEQAGISRPTVYAILNRNKKES